MEPAPGRPVMSVENIAALAAIDQYCLAHGYGPTLRELADSLHLASPAAARYHVLRLEAEGLVTTGRSSGRGQIMAHSIRITAAGRKLLAEHGRHPG